ncbi:MAG: hypothetical protein IJ716_06685 [Lachnospiraceae bacterium]|nr:hypothetical protein [Lachnospiraceae bacterium]
MQVGGIGSGNGNSGLDNHGVSHQTINYRIDDSTQNVNKHDTARRDVADEATSAYTVSFSSEGKRLAAEQMAARKATEEESAGQETGGLTGKLRELLESGKKLLLQIWGESKEEEAANEVSEEDDILDTINENLETDGDEYHESGIAAGAVNVQAPAGMTTADPYFNSNSDAGKVKEPLLTRIRIRFRDIAGQLAERFGGMLSGQFSAGSELKDRQEQQKDNLQAEQTAQEKHKKDYYRKNGVVVDISTPPAEHLMDSYDKAGEYSKLTTEQKR